MGSTWCLVSPVPVLVQVPSPSMELLKELGPNSCVPVGVAPWVVVRKVEALVGGKDMWLEGMLKGPYDVVSSHLGSVSV